jgi:hypothetical protein
MNTSQYRTFVVGVVVSVIPSCLGFLAWYLAGVYVAFLAGLIFGMLTLLGPWIGLAAFRAVTRNATGKARFTTGLVIVFAQYVIIFFILPLPVDFYRAGLASTVKRELPLDEFRTWAYEQANSTTNNAFAISAKDAPAFLRRGPLAAKYEIEGLIQRDGAVTNMTLIWNAIGVTIGPNKRVSEDRTMIADDMQIFVAVRQ